MPAIAAAVLSTMDNVTTQPTRTVRVPVYVPTPVPAVNPYQLIGWTQNLVSFRGQTRQTISVYCPPNGTAGTVWGTDLFTDDSSVCTAGVHSGRISFAQGGTVRATLLPGVQSYVGTQRGGVSSRPYGTWHGSFVLEGGAAPGLVAMPLTPPEPPAPVVEQPIVFSEHQPVSVRWNTNAVSLRGRNGQHFVAVCPAQGTTATVWGAGVYTDDSSICTAAVHAGRITLEQGGMVDFMIAPGRNFYPATTQHGVSTSSWQQWSGSFVFTALR